MRFVLIIDTNTLYYAFGLSKHSNVDSATILKVIDELSDVNISSISFAEFIAKYHKHAGTIRKVCSFMRQHHIGICQNEYIPLDADIIKILSKTRQKDLDKIYNGLLNIKSYVESRFATVVFFVVLFCDVVFECNINPYSVPECIYDFFSKVFKDTLRPIIINFFNLAYQKAYKTNDAENIIRKWFYDYLKMFVSLCVPLCKHVVEKYNKTPVEELIDVKEIISEYSDVNWSQEMTSYQKRIEKQDTPSKFIQKKGISYGKRINDKHLTALLNGLNNSFKKVIKEPSIEEYLFSIVSNTLSNGGAFRKNDINDALILSSLNTADIILSFDDKMIEHMKKYSSSRVEYQNSIELINSIKG